MIIWVIGFCAVNFHIDKYRTSIHNLCELTESVAKWDMLKQRVDEVMPCRMIVVSSVSITLDCLSRQSRVRGVCFHRRGCCSYFHSLIKENIQHGISKLLVFWWITHILSHVLQKTHLLQFFLGTCKTFPKDK